MTGADIAEVVGIPAVVFGGMGWWMLGHFKLWANPPWWPLVIRRNPGYRFPPPRYLEPDVYDYRSAQKEFAALCKAYEDDIVRMGGNPPDPAEVARAVAEQLRLPYSYGMNYEDVVTTEVYFQGHPSARYMQGGTALTCNRLHHKRFKLIRDGEMHWADDTCHSYEWR